MKRGFGLKCQYCGASVDLPFKCSFCGGHFCSEHRLPEAHSCQNFKRGLAVSRSPITMKRAESSTPVFYRRESSRILKFPFSSKRSPEMIHVFFGILIVAFVGASTAVATFGLLNPLLILLLILIFTLAFILHEFAHKFVAKHYGLWAEFRLSPIGVIITLISIFIPLVKIVSPGAVLIFGAADERIVGRISLSGPLINMLLSVIYLALNFLMTSSGLLRIAYWYGLAINAYVALFNLIPFGNLDGRKIFEWNKPAWLISFIIALVLTITAFT